MASDGRINLKSRCSSDETLLSFDLLKGSKGETGLTGEKGEQGISGPQGQQGLQGPQGLQGSPGELRIYGDGSAGDRIISSSIILNDSNPQYQNFVINSGVTLTVPSGTIIRCRESFINNGTLQVLSAARNSTKYAENGGPPTSEPSATDAVAGGLGGNQISEGLAKSLLKPGLANAGDGNDVGATQSSGFGGGTIVIMAAESASNAGLIVADGDNGTALSSGGGAGGLIIIASKEEVDNSGSLRAAGGNGASYQPDNGSAAYAAGGGGGGGIVHLFATQVNNSGTTNVTGGNGGSAGAAGSLTAILKYGGRGGGGSGGDGGDGGTANPGNAANGSCSAGMDGGTGKVFVTQADPTAFL